MRLKLLRFIFIIGSILLFSINLKAQSFSFNCSRDTIVPGCPPNLCITLKGIIPDIHGLSSSYSLNPGSPTPGCFPIYGAPDDPAGTPTGLIIDDRYSSVITPGFPFPFYGTIYNSLVASTNGYISFDVSLANGFSHYQNFGNLPNTQYDGAIIMGPYHDLFPGQPTSPTQRIQYQVFGTAPQRRWILSFYKVPLYQCTGLIQNTHQIILYESTGIFEIKIFDKEICFAWQGGKSMVGIQDITKTQWMTAPLRRMSDPAWGSVGMNETWRFVPNAGPSLLKRVELYDLLNNLIATGVTAPLSPGVLDVSFPNVCAPAGAITTYIIKSVYEKIDDPLVEIFGTDTVRVNRSVPLTGNATSSPAGCGISNGSITVSGVTGGTPPYEYSLDGISWQFLNVFPGLAAGTYTVWVRDVGAVCVTTLPPVIVGLSGILPALTTPNATSCPGMNNGSIIVNSAGGIGPYTFSIDGSLPLPGIIPYTFPGLTSGVHTVIVNDIGTGCNTGPLFINVPVGLGITGFTSTTQTSCPGVADGIITATALTGIAPFTWSLDGGPFVPGTSPHTFPPVAAGPHVVRISDNLGCIAPFNADVIAGPGIIVNASSTPAACATANNGTITITPTNGTAPYTYSLDGAPAVPGGVPYFIPNQPAGLHTIIVNDATGCSTNPAIIVIISAGSGVSGTATPTATTCPAASNGQIIVDATAGIAPFTYQLDGGPPQSSPNPYTFPNVTAGLHTVVITDNFGCTFTINNVNVNAGPPLAATTTTNPTTCSGASNGSITVTPTNGMSPFMFSLDGAPPFSNPVSYTFNNVSAGTHNIIVTDASGCSTTPPVTVTVVAGPMLTTTANVTDVLCNGGATGTITVIQPTIGTAPYEYSLNGGPWQSSNFFGGRPAGTYTVGYRESNGCMGSHQEIISEPAVMTSSAVTVAAVCNGDPNGIITITAGGGVAPYQYSIDGGLNWQASNVFNRGAGIYTIIIRDANNCTTFQSATVTEPALLTSTSVNNNASCDGGNDGMIIVNAAGGNAGYTYSIDGVNFQVSDTFYVAPGPYTIRVKDNLGCVATFNTVVGLTNNLTFTPQIDPTICEGNSTQLQLISNATIYSWTPATGLSNSTIPDPVANPTVTTQYTVTATLGRCSANDIVIVNVNSAPVPDAGPDGFICYGQTYQLQGSGGVQYTWTPSTNLSSTTISNPVSTPVKTITYTLSDVIDAIGCKSLTTDQVTVDVTPPIKVKTYPYDTISYPGDQFQLNATSAATFYSWSPVTGLSNPNIANPVLTVGPVGTDVLYQVTAYTAAGCKGEGYVSLKVYNGPELYVPSAFTPNGDGLNDLFYPFPVGIRSINYFRVFNRWGQMLFTSTTLNKGWDGKLQGVEQPTGTYVFMAQGVDKNGKLLTRKGTVTLIK